MRVVVNETEWYPFADIGLPPTNVAEDWPYAFEIPDKLYEDHKRLSAELEIANQAIFDLYDEHHKTLR